MATKPQILRKLQAYKKNPELIKEVSNTELADLVLIVMRAVETIEQSMESKRVDVERKYDSVANDLLTQSERQNRDLLQAVQTEVKRLVNQSETVLSETTTELEKRVQQAIENIRNGEDGIVSDEEIERAANIAASLIEPPDFESMMTEAIQGNGALIRDALESLPEGDEQLTQESVQGLVPRLRELQERIERISTASGGTIGKNQVYGFIAQAIADGTIPSGGSSLPEQSGNAGKFLTTDGSETSWGTPAGSGDVVGPASAVDDNIATFNTTTGKLIQDSGAKVSDFATAAQGALADTATQPADVANFETTTELNARDTANRDTDNHTDGTTNKVFTATEKTKLSGIAESANNYTHPNHSGDVTSVADGATTIANNAVTNAKAADMATATIKGRATAGTGDPEDLTATQVRTLLNVEDGATANSADATLLARANHTGTQAASTISDFDTEVANNSAVAANTAKVSYPGSATATELNILDGATVTTDELNILDGVTATTAEINKLDGVAGDVVGTTDTQTVTNKDLTATTNKLRFQKTISIEDPTATEDISFFFTNNAITITEMRAVLVGSATPSVTWTVRHGTDRSAAGAEVVTSGTTTTSTTTGSDVTSFNDATIVADSHVWVETSAQSGTVDNLIITVFYTED